MPNDSEYTGQQAIERSPALRALENLRMRLLDLTARNRLINFRHTKGGSLRVIDELPNQLVETLLADTGMRFEAIPEPTEEQLIAAGYLRFDEETQQLVRQRNDPDAVQWARHRLTFPETGHSSRQHIRDQRCIQRDFKISFC
jgi:hypothetical protein